MCLLVLHLLHSSSEISSPVVVSQGPEVCRSEPDVHEEPVAALRSQPVPDGRERGARGEDCGGPDRQLLVCLRSEYS